MVTSIARRLFFVILLLLFTVIVLLIAVSSWRETALYFMNVTLQRGGKKRRERTGVSTECFGGRLT